MATMHAAVVTSFDEPPHYREFEVPAVPGPDHQLVDVLAVGLHPRVRSGASGKHYTSTGELPMIPGVDGVGRLADGDAVFFLADGSMPGPMAEKAVVDMSRTIRLPAGADVLEVAAGMNPAMSSWVALRSRVSMQPGSTVMVLGATGNAGSMAVQVAKLLGAARVIAVARNRSRLAELRGLGADVLVPLTADGSETAAEIADVGKDVDIVLDYLWGAPAEQVMSPLMMGRDDPSEAIDWIQIGAVAGATIGLPSAILRASNLRILGNGQGSVSPAGYMAELPSLVDVISAGDLVISARAQPLANVEKVWANSDSSSVRTVLIP